MPNTQQAKKRMVQDERRRLANKAKRTAMRTAVKKVLQADSAEVAARALPDAVKKIDKCAKTSIIHDNTAARKKSQLAKHVSKLSATK